MGANQHSNPWTADEDAKLTELHAAGKSLHAIATDMGRSKSTVNDHAAQLGISFDRSRTAKAAQAVVADNKLRRARLIGTLYDRAEELLEQIVQPHLVFNFGGKDNSYEERQVDRPPTADIRNLMQSASIAMQRAVDLENVDAVTATDLPAVDAWIEAMTGGTG